MDNEQTTQLLTILDSIDWTLAGLLVLHLMTAAFACGKTLSRMYDDDK